MSKIIKLILCFSFCFVATLGFFAHQNDTEALRLILKRIVLEDAKRAEVLTLINGSDESETYRLLWKEMVMTPSDGLKDRKDLDNPPTVPPAKDMIKFSPRRVTLPPGGSQQIRMVLRTPSGLSDGEYRSHLWIRKEVDVEKINLDPNVAPAQTQKKVEITLLPGVTIPVIVRKGNLPVKVTVANASAISNGNNINVDFSLNRAGQKSVYGDIDFYCNPMQDPYPLKSLRGIAIYTELTQKSLNAKLTKPADEAACREMLIRYVETNDYGGQAVKILAEKIIQVQ